MSKRKKQHNLRSFAYLTAGQAILVFNTIKAFIGEVLRARKGNRFSRIFRQIFQYIKIKRIVGFNLAFVFAFSTIVPKTHTLEATTEADFVTRTPLVLTTEQGVQYPVKSVKITQNFKFYHPGIDFDGITGDDIFPLMSGRVIEAGYSRLGYGNNVIVNHGNGLTTLYAHLSVISVKVGEEVTMSSKLGQMGATGRAFGDHLHFEVRENGNNINPLTLISR